MIPIGILGTTNFLVRLWINDSYHLTEIWSGSSASESAVPVKNRYRKYRQKRKNRSHGGVTPSILRYLTYHPMKSPLLPYLSPSKPFFPFPSLPSLPSLGLKDYQNYYLHPSQATQTIPISTSLLPFPFPFPFPFLIGDIIINLVDGIMKWKKRRSDEKRREKMRRDVSYILLSAQGYTKYEVP